MPEGGGWGLGLKSVATKAGMAIVGAKAGERGIGGSGQAGWQGKIWKLPTMSLEDKIRSRGTGTSTATTMSSFKGGVVRTGHERE